MTEPEVLEWLAVTPRDVVAAEFLRLRRVADASAATYRLSEQEVNASREVWDAHFQAEERAVTDWLGQRVL